MRAEERANQCVSLLSSIKMHEASTFIFLKGSLIKGYKSLCRRDFQKGMPSKFLGYTSIIFCCLKIKSLTLKFLRFEEKMENQHNFGMFRSLFPFKSSEISVFAVSHDSFVFSG